MRDCVRRFAEAMDAAITEKMDDYGNVEDTITDTTSLNLARAATQFMDSTLEDGDDRFLRNLIHTSNFCMMAWNKKRVHGG